MSSDKIETGAQAAIRVAFVGTGYIADFHARGVRAVPGAELVAVVDANPKVAEAFAAARGIKAYPSLDAMLAEQQVDVAHVLVPPDAHHNVTRQVLEAGLHAFVEKPMAVTVAEVDDLLALAASKGLTIGVNHSMTFIPAYEKLRGHIRAGDLGPIDHVTINHLSELGVIRAGPFSNWIVREPGNALLEIGPHPVSELIDLAGMPDAMDVTADRDVLLPGGARAYRRWRIHARAGRVAADINLEFSPGFAQRTIAVRGALGAAYLDFNANTCTIERQSAASLDFERRRRSLDQARQIKAQARQTIKDTLLSKVKLGGAGNPDQMATQGAVAAFYAGLRDRAAADPRVSGENGRQAIQVCADIIREAKLQPGVAPAAAVAPAADLKPTILVIGGTGFIGRRLIAQLLDAGHAVRVAGRGGSPALEALGSDRLQIVRADLRSAADIDRALDGIEVVYHLATTGAKSWPEFQEQEIEPTRKLAEACLAKGVRRLIYTGTIDSYYAGGGTIVEDTPLDPKIERRNNYARAKAAVEDLLTDLHRTRGLPLVIARPGIVIGEGGNPFHWGVARWSSEGVAEVWGDGTNPLPFVLVDDVAAGLVLAMDTPGIEGKSFNFIDLPLLNAHDYVGELERQAGMRIDAQYRPIWKFWAEDMSKWPLKVAVGHPDGQRRPSYHDWQSRTQKAFFDCTRTRAELGWAPASDRQRLIDEGIGGSLKAWLAARS